MPIRVMLVDDHAVVRDGLRALLEAESDIVVMGEAADGRQAVREAQRIRPDVVVMDIAMPEMGGIEACRQIRDVCASARLIILSMYHTSEHIFRAFGAGAHGYVLKESGGAEIVRAIRAVHAGRVYRCRQIEETAMTDTARRRTRRVTKSPLERLSPREWEVFQGVVEGKSSRSIAEALQLSPKSVETYRSRLMQKLGVRGVPALVKFAIHHGVTRSE